MNMCFDLEVNAGEILSVIGPSGSGKSTLLNLIAGFNTQTSGEIWVDENEISEVSAEHRPVTMVFQEHNLFPHLDVFTNIAIGIKPSLKLTPDETESINLALEKVGLNGFSKRLPGKLSGGQRQRVTLARALVREQSILLLDEPFAALGPAMREEIIDLLKDLVKEKQMAALLVSHQPTDAIRASRKTIFIHQGQVLESAESANILNKPEHREIRQYLGNCNDD